MEKGFHNHRRNAQAVLRVRLEGGDEAELTTFQAEMLASLKLAELRELSTIGTVSQSS